MSDDLIELTPDLLDDFYAECEEHLGNIRTQLTALDEAQPVDRQAAVVEGLYRSIHSFKGNAAIVGLADAEQLAHATEAVLRRLSRGEAAIDPGTVDLLAQVALRLEQLVASFRTAQPLPSTDDLLLALGSELEVGDAPAPWSVERRSTAEQPPPAGSNWRATFSPTPELDRRGVNLNSIRKRLTELGPIIAARPVVDAGRIRFDFTIAVQQSPADEMVWTADGVSWQPPQPGADAPEPVAAEATAATPEALFVAPAHIIRVDLGRLDELMRIAGEMVIHRSRLQDRIAQLNGDGAPLQEVNLGLGRSLRELRRAIMRVRMVPVREIFNRLPFVVRDLTRGSTKSVRLVLEGQETEIDKYLVERLKEPLLHLVRNAVSHGVETEDERTAAGKTPEATLLLSAFPAGNVVELRVRDDGRGIDPSLVSARAQAAGLAVPEPLTAPALLRLLCTPGFSTRDEADRAAGRGVGMAVVDSTVRELGGSLAVRTEVGRFTEFTLRLPLTLSVAETFIVTADSQLCAVPQDFIDEVIQIPAPEVHWLGGGEVGPHRGSVLPLIRLRRLFGATPEAQGELPVLVLKTDRGMAGLVVDRIVGQREVVVRPINDTLIRVPGISGATELGDGRPVLILDPAGLLEATVPHHPAGPPQRFSVSLR